ncbi:hypothetical protein C8R43DRAFT_902475 [Mycena crocata]|nr:hypothetical protein C8R43DRAFT_902475 [Mycena crocata]
MRTRLTRGIQRFWKLQAVYTPASLQAAAQASAPIPREKIAVKPELPEDTPLFLPSALSEQERSTCAAGLVNIEGLAHDAQCRTALQQLRNQLHVKMCLLVYKKRNARHQGANTCSRTIIARNESKIKLHSEKYQTAWEAIHLLQKGDASKVAFLKLRKRDIRCMEDTEELKKKDVKCAKQAAARAAKKKQLVTDGEIPASELMLSSSEDEGDEPAARGGEVKREILWIWAAAGTCRTDAEFEDGAPVSWSRFGLVSLRVLAALRIEWAKAYAQSRRWKEEVKLLEEESHRVEVSFEWMAYVWDQRAQAIQVGSLSATVVEGGGTPFANVP